ncbi:MAG: hypothetical protein IID09_07380, partial [Candidatus Hydrogenedentes bacterium]|nr:hypothetical protein [Candidatus Hydrogenedentota bacterium]
IKVMANEVLQCATRLLENAQSEEQTPVETGLFKETPDAANLMAALDAVAFDRRAKIITQFHPLAMQVHLDTGVANGVLVVRTAKTCADLLYGLLRNDLTFDVKPRKDRDEEVGTVLVEDISESNFRYVTHDRLLTNSFWNFYLSEEEEFPLGNNKQAQGGQ